MLALSVKETRCTALSLSLALCCTAQLDKLDVVKPMSYLERHRQTRRGSTPKVELQDPWMDLFWRAFADERYFLALHLIGCKVSGCSVSLRWFDRVPYFSSRELLAMVMQEMPQAYYTTIGWLFAHIKDKVARMGIAKALDSITKISELLHLPVSPSDNTPVLAYLASIGLYDHLQSASIKWVLKEKRQVVYCVDRLSHAVQSASGAQNAKDMQKAQGTIPRRTVSRIDSKMDQEDNQNNLNNLNNLNKLNNLNNLGNHRHQEIHAQRHIEIHASVLVNMQVDLISCDMDSLDGQTYFALNVGCRRDNNEIQIYRGSVPILQFRNYHTRPFTIVRFMRGTGLLVTADMAFDIGLWDALKGTCLAVWRFHSRIVNELLCVSEGLKIYSCSSDNSVRSFRVPQSVSALRPGKTRSLSVRHQKLVFALNYPSNSAFCNEPISSITIGQSEGKEAILAASLYSVRIYQERTMKLLSVIALNGLKIARTPISRLLVHDLQLFVIAKNQMHLVSMEDKKVIRTLSDRDLMETRVAKPVVYVDKYLVVPATQERPLSSVLVWRLDGKTLKRVCNVSHGYSQLVVSDGQLYGISNQSIEHLVLNE